VTVPVFKTGGRISDVVGGFDSHSLPPFTTVADAHKHWHVWRDLTSVPFLY
jgi:hypothetical protein